MSDPVLPIDLLHAALDRDPAAPLVTFYDDATGERVELSAKTFGNWVAKTANLLVDGLGAQPGDQVTLALPPHWQTAVWLFACWSAGLVTAPVEPGGELDGDILAVTEPDIAHATGASEVVGLSLQALGGSLRDCPPGVTDYAVDVRGYGDRFTPYAPIDPDAPALALSNPTEPPDVMSVTLSGAEVNAETFSFVENSGLTTPARVLSTVSYTSLEGLLAGLLGPIAAGGSVIIQRNLDKDALDRRISLEHVTAVTGVPGWDAASGSAYWSR